MTLRVVTAPLAIDITSPASGTIVQGPFVELHGTATEDLPVATESGTQSATVANGAWTLSAPLGEGRQVVRVTGRDAAGRTATDEITLTVDTLAPVLRMHPPASVRDECAERARVGTVTDAGATGLTLSYLGQAITVRTTGDHDPYNG